MTIHCEGARKSFGGMLIDSFPPLSASSSSSLSAPSEPAFPPPSSWDFKQALSGAGNTHARAHTHSLSFSLPLSPSVRSSPLKPPPPLSLPPSLPPSECECRGSRLRDVATSSPATPSSLLSICITCASKAMVYLPSSLSTWDQGHHKSRVSSLDYGYCARRRMMLVLNECLLPRSIP